MTVGCRIDTERLLCLAVLKRQSAAKLTRP